MGTLTSNNYTCWGCWSVFPIHIYITLHHQVNTLAIWVWWVSAAQSSGNLHGKGLTEGDITLCYWHHYLLIAVRLCYSWQRNIQVQLLEEKRVFTDNSLFSSLSGCLYVAHCWAPQAWLFFLCKQEYVGWWRWFCQVRRWKLLQYQSVTASGRPGLEGTNGFATDCTPPPASHGLIITARYGLSHCKCLKLIPSQFGYISPVILPSCNGSRLCFGQSNWRNY